MCQNHLQKNKTNMRYLSPISIGIFTPKADFILCNEKEIDSTIRLRKLRKSK
jgi:hypothetical protein